MSEEVYSVMYRYVCEWKTLESGWFKDILLIIDTYKESNTEHDTHTQQNWYADTLTDELLELADHHNLRV